MKRFQFRLEPFLRLKEFREREAQQALARARADVQECETRIQKGAEMVQDAVLTLETEVSEGIRADDYRRHLAYIGIRRNALEAEKRRLLQLRRMQVKRQQELAAKSKEKKILEKLRERRRTDYYQSMEKLLQSQNDDMVTIREARKIVSAETDEK